MAHSIAVTGASGFVGVPLCALLVRSGVDVHAAVRHRSAALAALAADPASGGRLRQVEIGELGAADWSAALAGARTVVHLAARVHRPGASGQAERDRFRAINAEATVRLAHAAGHAGVRRLIFVSSAKAGDAAHDQDSDAYSASKAEAERRLGEASDGLGLELVILRPPLVYGPGVRANFLRLLRLVDSGVPLPLASVANRRSLLFVGNLVDALRACIEDPRAAGRTFGVSDGEDVSTPELVRRIARALGRPARLFPLPAEWLRLAGRLAGQIQAIDRLTGDLVVDSAPIREAFGWSPPFSMEQGLAETAAWYRARRDGTATRTR